MKEIPKAKTVEFYIVLGFDVRQILFVKHEIMDGVFAFSLLQEMRILGGRTPSNA
jgi:hypothetical protein